MQQFGILILAGQTQKWDLGEFTTIGSDLTNTVAIPGLSDRHARIEYRQGAPYLRDLRTGRSKINGTPVLEAPLADGDVIQLGPVELEFCAHFDPLVLPAPHVPWQSRNEHWSRQLQSLPTIAKSQFPVLFLGESGTGKERLARSIHDLSDRRHAPYVSVNCSALSETLIESELFGHIRGSFTGATNDRRGAFEAARGGTLFLDEIGDFPLHLQPKLLRALENQEIRPVGNDKTVQTDVRIVAATHQNLSQKVARGEFRADLFYRLHVITLRIPSLKERVEDFESLLFDLAREHRVRFSVDAIEKLKSHSWPGNIRELRNAVARASARFGRANITAEMTTDLVDVITTAESPFERMVNFDGRVPVVKEIERDLIVKRLVANHGNQRQTARDLGMPKSTLHDRLKLYQIDLNELVRAKSGYTHSGSALSA